MIKSMQLRQVMSVLVALSAGGPACTDADLRGMPVQPSVRDDKLRITGDFCTEDPSTLLFPVRVLLMVDASESMRVTDEPDPVTGMPMRERAAREAVESLLANDSGGVSIGVIRFSAEAQPLTFADENGNGARDDEEGYFTRNRAQLLGNGTDGGVLALLRETDRTSSFLNALSMAYSVLRDEMDRADDASLPLSKYVMVFLSDFLPDVDGSESRENTNERILAAVDDIVELGQLYRVGHMELNFAYISTARDEADRRAEDLGRSMAVHGQGSFRSFPNNEELNFLFADLSALRRVFTLQTMVAVNISTVSRGIGSCGDGVDRHLVLCPENFDSVERGTCCQPPQGNARAQWDLEHRRICCDRDGDGFESTWCGGGDCDDWDNQSFPGATRFLADSDFDGLADEDEWAVLSEPGAPDSDGDGFSDLLEHRFRTSGLDPLDPLDADCPAGEVAVTSVQCNDSMDNDGDGNSFTKENVDINDPGCMSAFDDDETDGTVVPLCVDGLDNDNDGWVDGADPDCQAGQAETVPAAGDAPRPQCNDGEDNDNDGFIDQADEGCSHGLDDDEQGIAPAGCRDGVDNDLDGWVDGADPDCVAQEHLRDNDGDGLSDCEERFYGTNRQGADTDADGLPDAVEVRFDVSAVNNDLLDDYDRDHAPNGTEIRLGTDPRFNDAGGRARNSYRYAIQSLGVSRRATEIGGLTLHACNDGQDNDGDGLIDGDDGDCQSALQETEEPLTEPTCLDGVDNDGDGWIDLDDAGCLKDQPEISLGTTVCNDGEDNDIDGQVDGEDSGCLTGFQATEDEIFEPTCLDMLDNDHDGWIDELDPDCAQGRREAARSDGACNNGLDDDGDDLIDALDPDCRTGFQTVETALTEPSCTDGTDNDGDGWVDELDPACALDRPEYATAHECNDGLDNDGDGRVDSHDGDCLVAVGGREARVSERNCHDGQDNDSDGWLDEDDPECLSPGSRSCYTFAIDNITLVQTQGNGWNRVLVYAGQVPLDDPTAFARFRVACVDARYVCSLDEDNAAMGLCDANFKEPPSGHFRVAAEQFVRLEDFDPRLHCQEVWEGF
jgi:hypothetical protein